MTRSMSARVTKPGRRSRGGVVVRSRTVDSIPPGAGPPSRSRSMRPSRPRRTCSARVGESAVERLALGAATGTPAARINANGLGQDGFDPESGGRKPPVNGTGGLRPPLASLLLTGRVSAAQKDLADLDVVAAAGPDDVELGLVNLVLVARAVLLF